MNKEKSIAEYDVNNNCIYSRDINGIEYWREYDAKSRLTHYRNSNGYEYWHEYGINGNCVHYWTNKGSEYWYWEGKITKDPIKILLLQKRIRDEAASI